MIQLSTPLPLVPFVAVDVETTGLDPARDAIVEIGAVRVQGGKIVDQFETLVAVDRTIPLAARRIHGIRNDMLVGKPRIAEALPLFMRFAGQGALVEHSFGAFDVAFLEQALGQDLPFPLVNTHTLSRKLFPHMRRHSLEECCKRHGIQNTRAHRALSDATATATLLLCLLELCGTRYPRLQDLLTVASVQRGLQRRSS
jgi:DNA polymerase III epsilon subunit family exonuclease